MPQVFQPGAVLVVKVALVAVVVAAVFVVVLSSSWAPLDEVSVGAANAQLV